MRYPEPWGRDIVEEGGAGFGKWWIRGWLLVLIVLLLDWAGLWDSLLR